LAADSTSWPTVALGCGNFGGVGSAPEFYGRGTSEETAWSIMDAAWERGIRWFDTADAYGGGRSEAFIGRWRAARHADALLVTTKVYNPVRRDMSDYGLRRDRIRREVEGSLVRLGVDRIDLYLAHEHDPETPVAETVGAFEELVAEGTIGAWGLSNYDAPAIEDVLEHGRPALVQNSYSLLERDDEAAVLPLCGEQRIAYVPFGPLAGGWLTGKYARGEPFPSGSRMTQRPEPYEHLVADGVFDGLDRFAAEADRRRVDRATLAHAWVLSNPLVSGVVCGPTRPEHLAPVLAALDVQLSGAERERIGSFFA
jgi:aryl-alcohol dehydrogenase-like predicted oxidoreductase